MNVITLSFTDFKRVCDEYSKRLYYYITDNIMDVYIISDGILVWSYIDLNTIENKEAFFGQKMFSGSMKLMYKIPVTKEQTALLDSQIPFDLIQSIMPVENQTEYDLQKSGVE